MQSFSSSIQRIAELRLLTRTLRRYRMNFLFKPCAEFVFLAFNVKPRLKVQPKRSGILKQQDSRKAVSADMERLPLMISLMRRAGTPIFFAIRY